LLWAASFWIGYTLVKGFYNKEKIDEKLMDPLLYSVLIGAVLGARLGHVIFYDYDWYFTANNPAGENHISSILNIREGGLASHGGVIGVIIAVWWYAKYKLKSSMLFVFDKLAIPSALACTLIRLGNFFNSEIVGVPTEKSWGIIFVQNGEDFARHPAQLYEAISYLITFILLWILYTKKEWYKMEGKLFGLFLMLIFTARFFIEFVKNSQEGFQEFVNDALSTGQLLSIPFVIIGLFFFFRPTKSSENTTEL
jgi:prolipoprotein diacylglyceryl transferase